jgi:hypothetical protein
LATNIDTKPAALFLRTSTHSEETARVASPNPESPHSDLLQEEAS